MNQSSLNIVYAKYIFIRKLKRWTRDCTHGTAPTVFHPNCIAPIGIAPNRIAPTLDCTHTGLHTYVIAPKRDCTHTTAMRGLV